MCHQSEILQVQQENFLILEWKKTTLDKKDITLTELELQGI
jgi:hypothetical protein